MIDANECKVPAYVVDAFSIVRQNLSDARDVNWEVLLEKAHLSKVNPFPIDSPAEQEGDFMSKEEFLSRLKGEKTPIVMGLSQPRVIAVEPDPVVEASDYRVATLNDSSERTVVGLSYLPTQTWSAEDSVLVYLRLLDDMPEKEFNQEVQTEFYSTMLSKLVGLLFKDGAVNRTFAKLLAAEDRGWEVNRMVYRDVHQGFELFFNNTRRIHLGTGEGNAV